jgi:hypothetical protein
MTDEQRNITVTQTALRELDALVAEMVGKLLAPVNNPLLAIEQLRGRVLRYPVPQGPSWVKRPIKERLNAIQSCCDELHHGLRGHPEAECWSTELIAYERAMHQREREARDEAALDAIEETQRARSRCAGVSHAETSKDLPHQCSGANRKFAAN